MCLFISQVSNIIYLDSPAGVGFSYWKYSSTRTTGDIETASDTHEFLLKVIRILKCSLIRSKKEVGK